MLNQKERLENYVANATQIELETTSSLEREAIEMLQKGYNERFVANKTFLGLKRVKQLKELV